MVATSDKFSFTVGSLDTSTAGGDHIVYAAPDTISYPRESLDKNGSFKGYNGSNNDFTWAGTSTTMNWQYNVGTWTPAMQKKFTPKTIKRRGWRE